MTGIELIDEEMSIAIDAAQTPCEYLSDAVAEVAVRFRERERVSVGVKR